MADSAEDVVNRFIAGIEAKDADAIGACVSDDIYYDNVPIGATEGKDAMFEFLGPMLAGEGPVEFEIVRQTAAGNVVMNERVDKFQTKSGRDIALPVTGVFEVNEGLITFWRDYFDNGMFMKQIKG